MPPHHSPVRRYVFFFAFGSANVLYISVRTSSSSISPPTPFTVIPHDVKSDENSTSKWAVHSSLICSRNHVWSSESIRRS